MIFSKFNHQFNKKPTGNHMEVMSALWNQIGPEERIIFETEKDKINAKEVELYAQTGVVPEWFAICGERWSKLGEEVIEMQKILTKYCPDWENHEAK